MGTVTRQSSSHHHSTDLPSSKMIKILVCLALSFIYPIHGRQLSRAEMDDFEINSGESLATSVRCGYFFVPGPNKKQVIYLIPRNYKPNCSEDASVHLDMCNQLFDHLQQGLKMTNPSQLSGSVDPSKALGDDLCSLLQNKNIRNTKRYWPNGMEVGMFYTACGNNQWIDTTKRVQENVCCRRGKFYKCPN